MVEQLRVLRDAGGDADALVVMSACDPANLYGPAREDGPEGGAGESLTFARVPSTWVVQHRGLPLLVAAAGGSDLMTLAGADDGLLRQAMAALLAHLAGFERRIRVESWNGEPVLDGPGASILEGAGFRRSYPEMVWDRAV